MWKRKEEEPVVANPVREPAPPPVKEVPTVSTVPQAGRTESWSSSETTRTTAHIGKSVVIRGELSGSEDLSIDGQVEGTIELRDHHLTVGPNGRVQANINAKEVVIQGTVKGNVRAIDRVEIRKSGSLTGDMVAARIVIEDGAFFKGSIDIQKGAEGHAKASESKKADAAPAPHVSEPKYAGAAVPVEAKKFN